MRYLPIIDFQMSTSANSTNIKPIAYQQLVQKIRHGVEPENPLLITLLLEHQHQLTSDKLLQKQCIEHFYLLLETVIDDLVPRHWRRTCLDHIYLPLCSLRRLSNSEQSAQQIQNLFNELAISTQYVEKSLSY